MIKMKRHSLLLFFIALATVAICVALIFSDHSAFQIREVVELSPDALREGAKDFEIGQDGFVSTSNDPWLEIDVQRGMYSELKLDVASVSEQDTTCAVYYCQTDDDGYSESRCVTAPLVQSGVTIALPGVQIDKLRLDLTDKEGVSIALNRAELVTTEHMISISKLLMAAACVLLAVLMASMVLTLALARKGGDPGADQAMGGGKRRAGGMPGWRDALGLSCPDSAERFYLALCFLIYAFWMIVFISIQYGPDEYMRYQIPEFIYLNGMLPKGWEESIRNPIWGVSYGFDISLPYLISAGFMWITSWFTKGELALLLAARLPGVLSMVGVGYFAILFSRKVLGDSPLRWVYIVLMTLLPQLVFLSSYVNLDAFSLLTVMMIIHGWVICVEQKWSLPTASFLAVALGLCFLSYKFAYSYILMTMLLYFAWHIVHRRQAGFRSFLLTGLLIVGIAFIICGWKFIRSAMLYDGDFLSLHASEPYAELYAQESFKPSVKQSIAEQGYSLMYVLRQMPWLDSTYTSLIGVFGYMNVVMPEWIYTLYSWLFATGAAGLVCRGILAVVNRRKYGVSKDAVLVALGLALASVITFGISLYFSWASDYQPQGRYIIAAAPMLFMVTAVGMDWWIAAFHRIPGVNRIRIERIQRLCSGLVIAFILFSLFKGTMICLKTFAYAGQSFPW